MSDVIFHEVQEISFWQCVGIDVQPRMIHMNAKTDVVENVTFMYCPADRQVQVAVPIKVCHRLT